MKDIEIYDIEILKREEGSPVKYYPPHKIKDATMHLINKYRKDTGEKLFNKTLAYYNNIIKISSGDDRFSGHMVRKIGTTLKCR